MVYNPTLASLKITTYDCTIQVQPYKTFFYFFGYKMHTRFPVYLQPVKHSRCTVLKMMKKDDILGPLYKQNENVWSTQNRFSF